MFLLQKKKKDQKHEFNINILYSHTCRKFANNFKDNNISRFIHISRAIRKHLESLQFSQVELNKMHIIFFLYFLTEAQVTAKNKNGSCQISRLNFYVSL